MPSAQAAHVDSPLLGWYVPAGQLVQVGAPLPLKRPAAQIAHAPPSVLSAFGFSLPAAQGVGAPAPAVQKEPAVQSLGLAAPAGQ